MKLSKHFLMRLLIVVIPLLGLYVFAEIAFKANRNREHPTDVGLGIAIMLVSILLILFFGFIVDVVIRIKLRQRSIAIIDSVFLLLFIIPIIYICSLF